MLEGFPKLSLSADGTVARGLEEVEGAWKVSFRLKCLFGEIDGCLLDDVLRWAELGILQ